jgi:glutamate-1-semialdehyde 2,1-aminomutase
MQRAQKSLAGGVSSPFRANSPVPLFLKGGRGCRLQDVDNNEYIDYTLGWGPNILGYCHPKIVDAIRKAAEGPHTYGAQHELEYLVAEKIQKTVPCAERVAFTSSGSEAVQLALRLARAFTNRNLILKLEGHYHGWMDSVLLSYHPGSNEAGPSSRPHVVPGSRGQVPNAADNLRIRPWNQNELLEEAFEREGLSIAAVIMEPVLCNSGCILPLPGYLTEVKKLCQRYGALLIFDEIITGFRIAAGGAQAVYDVLPDLATFGKALGGGLPLSAVAGRKEILNLMFGGGVAFGGTFNGNVLSLAAADATLEELSGDSGALLVRANRIGQGLMQGIRKAAERYAVPVLITGFGTAFCLHHTSRAELTEYRDTFEDSRELLSQFLLLALAEGVYLLPDGRFYVSAVHSESDVKETLGKLEHVFRKLR